MFDVTRNQRAQRLRSARRERGERETNVWLSSRVSDEIDDAVRKGRFRSRQDAIAYALETVFVREELNVAM